MKKLAILLKIIFLQSCGNYQNVKNYPKLHSFTEEKKGNFTLKNLEKSTAVYSMGLSHSGYTVGRLDSAEMLFFPKENWVLYVGQHQFSIFDPNGKFLYGYERSDAEKKREDMLIKARYGYFLYSQIFDSKTKKWKPFFFDIRDKNLTKNFITELNTDTNNPMSKKEIVAKYEELSSKAEIVINDSHNSYFLIDNQWIALGYWDATGGEKGLKVGYPEQVVWWISDEKYYEKPLFNKNDKAETISFVNSAKNPAIGEVKNVGFKIEHKEKSQIAPIHALIPETHWTTKHYGYGQYEIKIENSLWKASVYTYRLRYDEPLEEVLFLFGMPQGYEHLAKVRFLLSLGTVTGTEREENCSFVVAFE